MHNGLLRTLTDYYGRQDLSESLSVLSQRESVKSWPSSRKHPFNTVQSMLQISITFSLINFSTGLTFDRNTRRRSTAEHHRFIAFPGQYGMKFCVSFITHHFSFSSDVADTSVQKSPLRFQNRQTDVQAGGQENDKLH